MRSNHWIRVVAVAIVALLLALPALAQTTATTGAIEGRVTDVNGQPIQGAKVTATGGRAPISATTNAQGAYLFANLPPGPYEIRIEKQGFGTVVQKDVLVNVSARRNVPFVLTPGQVETVSVTAEAPLIDSKSTTTGAIFTVEQYVDYIPVGRNFSDTFALAPGVVSGGGTGAGNYSISGSSGLENSYVVDGVNITNTGYGGIGSYNIVYGSLGSGVTFDFLEEIQVKTGGIDAEYGQATGGVVNSVVKSGTNAISGAVGVFLSPKSMESGYKAASLSTGAINPTSENTVDLAGSIGGPIVKDKPFYFVAYNQVTTTYQSQIENLSLPTALPGPTVPATFPTAGGPQEYERTSNNWAAKLTWYANQNHRIEFSGFGDPSRGASGPQNTASLRNVEYDIGGGQTKITYGANNYAIKYDGVITPSFFVQAQIGRHDGTFEETSALDHSRVRDRRQQLCFLFGFQCNGAQTRDNGALWYYGGTGFLSNAADVNDQAKITATWVAGNHELKGGIQYDDIEYTDDQAYSGAEIPFLFTLDGDGDGNEENATTDCAVAAPGTDCYVTVNSTSGSAIDLRWLSASAGTPVYRSIRARFYPTPPPTTTTDLAIFLQDSWAINSRWNLKLGVRASQQEISGTGGFSLPFSVEGTTRVPGTSTYEPGEYKFDWAIAPRVGVTWDVSGDGRSKLYANLGRYFERIPNDLAVRALSNEVGITNYEWLDFDYATGIPNTPRYTVPGSEGRSISFQGLETTRIEDGTKLPYVDEIVLGYQRELGRDFSIELRAIYREQGRALEDVQYTPIEAIQNAYYSGDFYYAPGVDPFPGFPHEVFGEYVLANPGDNTTAPFGYGLPAAVRKYTAFEFVANKRFSENWLLNGSFVYSRLRGNYEGLYRNDNTQSDPNITSLFDFPLSPLTRGQFEEGPLNNDRPWVLKLYGSYKWDNGVTAGAGVNYSAGIPRTPLLAHPIYINAGELPGADPVYGWWSLDDPDADPLTSTWTTGTADEWAADPNNLLLIPILTDYTDVGRGNLGRTQDELRVDVNFQWEKRLKVGSFTLGASVFNLFNTQNTVGYNDFVEATAGTPDPDYLRPTTFQAPRSVRLMARWNY